MITPILKDPRPQGGTLYTFPSASRDLTRAFSNSEYEFVFSNFACLNLPDFRYGTFTDEYKDSSDNIIKGDLKGVYLDNIYENCIDLSDNLNNALKWHLQSYVMNYEIAILNGFSLDSSKYDNDILRTPSERIFFNWLKKVGAIKFKNNSEILDGYGDDLVSKTVQYIGTIDMINNVSIDYDSFNEIYLNIPAGVGGSEVKFLNAFDSNYENGNYIDVDNDDYLLDKVEHYIIGRTGNESVENKNTLKAIYDEQSLHRYKIDSGYCINFNDSEYSGGSIESMNLKSEEDFEFNCVLIYYKIRKGDGNWVTNLYGVLFLEEVTISDIDTDLNDDDERGGYIQRYPKFKNGNSWGLKLDLKIDAQPDSQMELRDIKYEDPNGGGAGMQMFTEALMQLSDCTKLFYDVKKENTDIEERLYKLENIVSGIDAVYELRDEVGILRTNMEMYNSSLNLLEGRLYDVESKVSKLQSNLGYLISDIKNIEKSLENKINSIADAIITDVLEDKLKDLEPNVQITDDNSLTITLK